MASFIIPLLLSILVTLPSFVLTDNLLFSCDFGTSTSQTFCGMVQGVDDSFDWKLTSTSGKAFTGPSQDHTGHTGVAGRFLWVDSDDGGPGQKATIATPPFNLTGDEGWLTFWYNLYEDGKLEISVCQDGEANLTFDENQGDEWHEQNITVSCGDDPVQITFTSTIRSSVSDVGVDDLYLLFVFGAVITFLHIKLRITVSKMKLKQPERPYMDLVPTGTAPTYETMATDPVSEVGDSSYENQSVVTQHQHINQITVEDEYEYALSN